VDLYEIPKGIVRDDDDLLEIFLTEFDIEMSEGDVEAVLDDYGLNAYLQPVDQGPYDVLVVTFSEQDPFDYADDLGGLDYPYPLIVLALEEELEGYNVMDMIYEELHHHEYVGDFEDIFDDQYIQDTFQNIRDGILDYNTEGLRVLEDASETEGVIAFTYEVGDQPEANLLLVLTEVEEGGYVAFALIHPQSMFIPR
jgi:hypothetical protein